ncbi:uncharacterized protein CTRU02_205867 [Colletotrichum truncatum]|uniref:Uncharacterized protein n=1 Tax=Colletotrichum truncatum TaxID=5467 RepID=A0ACC3Z587_COLTU|nr:uncharacterized protein CTRU02_04700 [Colletotrichum truncatum]KAF6795137.1 hypothetical protein CTRU02_04700 [Colletotrichum truncatum]
MGLGPSDSLIICPSHPGRATRTFLATPVHDSPNPCPRVSSPATQAVPGRLLAAVRSSGSDQAVGHPRTRYHSFFRLSSSHSPDSLDWSPSRFLSLPLLLRCRVCIFRSFEVELLLIVWNVESLKGKHKTLIVSLSSIPTRQDTGRTPTSVPSLPPYPLFPPTKPTDRHEQQ